MKKILLIVMCLCLVACAKTKEEDTEAPELKLKSSRVRVGLNSDIDYLAFIDKAIDEVDGELIDEVKYNEIDVSKVGQSIVTYTLKDQADNETAQKLIVDVVEYYDGGIFSPLDVEADTVESADDVTVLINKIPKGWTPDDLEPVLDNPSQMLRKEANEAYTRFYNDAKSKGIVLYSISGYRTNDLQTKYWNNMVKVYGEEYASQYSAYPGRSEHQLGLAMDVSYKTTGDRLSESVAQSDIGKFIVSDGYKYGFILRYPQDKVAITNYGYEPWHIRYVGVDLATQLHEQGITLEEYYND